MAASSSDRITEAEGRLSTVKGVRDDVVAKASDAQRLGKKVGLAATRKGAVSKILFEQPVTLLSSLGYAVFALVGMVYTAGFYEPFGVQVLDFFRTPDFLLSTVSGLLVLTIGVAAVLVTLALLMLFFSALIVKESWEGAKDTRRPRVWRVVVFSVAIATFVAPFVSAYFAGEIATTKIERKLVRVTLRGDSAQQATALPDPRRTMLLGTTSSFHFLYECKSHEEGRTGHCEDGNPFVVAADNVAALSFNHDKKPPETESESDIAKAIASLAAAITGLTGGGPIKIGPVHATMDTEDLTKAINALATAVSATDPDNTDDVTSAINALTESVGRHTPAAPAIRELSRMIARLDTAISALHVTIGDPLAHSVVHLAASLTNLRVTVATLVATGTAPICTSGLSHIGNVGPFPTGESGSASGAQPEIGSIWGLLQDKRPARLFLIGRVDNQQFTAEGLGRWDSDSRLAQERAEWVLGQLARLSEQDADHLADIRSRSTVLGGGPLHVGQPTEAELERDRIVEVWGCWTASDG